MSGPSHNAGIGIDHPEYIPIYIRILTMLEDEASEHGGANVLTIMDRTFLTYNAATTHLAWLQEKGMVNIQKGKSIFSITSLGKSWLQSIREGS